MSSTAMRCVGRGVYHRGPGGIEKPGDFGWQITGAQVDEQGAATGRPAMVQIALFCPRTGVCFQKVHQGPSGDFEHGRFWSWNGNWDQPTITPSIGCDDPRTRCGAHLSISSGIANGPWPETWTRPPREPAE